MGTGEGTGPRHKGSQKRGGGGVTARTHDAFIKGEKETRGEFAAFNFLLSTIRGWSGGWGMNQVVSLRGQEPSRGQKGRRGENAKNSVPKEKKGNRGCEIAYHNAEVAKDQKKGKEVFSPLPKVPYLELEAARRKREKRRGLRRFSSRPTPAGKKAGTGEGPRQRRKKTRKWERARSRSPFYNISRKNQRRGRACGKLSESKTPEARYRKKRGKVDGGGGKISARHPALSHTVADTSRRRGRMHIFEMCDSASMGARGQGWGGGTRCLSSGTGKKKKMGRKKNSVQVSTRKKEKRLSKKRRGSRFCPREAKRSRKKKSNSTSKDRDLPG